MFTLYKSLLQQKLPGGKKNLERYVSLQIYILTEFFIYKHNVYHQNTVTKYPYKTVYTLENHCRFHSDWDLYVVHKPSPKQNHKNAKKTNKKKLIIYDFTKFSCTFSLKERPVLAVLKKAIIYHSFFPSTYYFTHVSLFFNSTTLSLCLQNANGKTCQNPSLKKKSKLFQCVLQKQQQQQQPVCLPACLPTARGYLAAFRGVCFPSSYLSPEL